MRKDVIIYYILNDSLICECYYYGGILSYFFAKCHFKYLCKKYPYNTFALKSAYLSKIIEECEGKL